MADFLKTAVAAMVLAAIPLSSAAQQQCFETVEGPPVWTCGEGQHGSRSADFSRSCGWESGPEIEVEVQCPPAAQWVPFLRQYQRLGDLPGATPQDQMSLHQFQCALYRMRPTAIEGQVCASSNRRPVSGSGWESIRYEFAPAIQPLTRGGESLAQTVTMNTGIRFCTGPGGQLLAVESQSGPTNYAAHASGGVQAIACETCDGGPCPLPQAQRCNTYGTNCQPSPIPPETIFGPPRSPSW